MDLAVGNLLHLAYPAEPRDGDGNASLVLVGPLLRQRFYERSRRCYDALKYIRARGARDNRGPQTLW